MDVTRALSARRLAADLSALSAAAAALADALVYEATRQESAEVVAAALGVSVPAVRKAIRQHNDRIKKAR